MDYVFYVVSIVLLGSVFCYFILLFKVHLQTQNITEIQNRIANSSQDQQKMYQTKFSDYKKKIDDFSALINNHKISSGIFVFIEGKTLPNVWFSNFDMSQSINGIKLSGEADTMETVGRQIQLFEQDQYVKHIDIVSSEVEPTGKVKFLLNLSLDPAVFNYANNPLWK